MPGSQLSMPSNPRAKGVVGTKSFRGTSAITGSSKALWHVTLGELSTALLYPVR